jgi:hypothetical protein
MAGGDHDICFSGEIGTTEIWKTTVPFTLTKIVDNMSPVWDYGFSDWSLEVY